MLCLHYKEKTDMATEEEKLNNFLAALDAVIQDHTCAHCSQMLKDPVTLSTCFHLVCSAHFESLTHCPTCKIPLNNCTHYKDEGLEIIVDSAQELAETFKEFERNPLQEQSSNILNKKSTSEAQGSSKKRGKSSTSLILTPENADYENQPGKTSAVKTCVKNQNSPQIQKKNKSGTTSAVNSTPVNIVKRNLKRSNVEQISLNSTVLSSASSDINKGNIEKKNKKGETDLHIACRLGKLDKVVTLLNQGALTSTKDHAGWTPLHEVVQNGRLDLVKLLIQHDTLIDVPGLGNETPLHEAIRYGHKEIAIELVKHGANVKARNCKGETPMQLAPEELKPLLEQAQENAVRTQGINLTYISELHAQLDSENIHAYCVRRKDSFRTLFRKLKLLEKHHPNLHVEVKNTKKVTHLFVDTDEDNVCTSTLEVLQGIASGIWIISTDWITKSTEEKLEPLINYEVVGVGTKTNNGPRNSRYNKYKQLPGIFNGCHFHITFSKHEVNPTFVLDKFALCELVKEAGGVFLRRDPNPELIPESEQLVPYHALEGSALFNCSHYVIYSDIYYEPKYNMSHIKALPIGWLIECLERYELCEPW